MEGRPPRKPLHDEIKEEWEARARSPLRDFFVASHPGWDDPAAWRRQAASDARLALDKLDRDWLRGVSLLEIGCGVGRLAPLLLESVRDYSGFDISPSMVAAARAMHGSGRARFVESSGIDVPESLKDRRYGLVIALAVFIHCPLPVIESLAEAAMDVLDAGGELRFQLRADPSDDTGISVSPATEACVEVAGAVGSMPGEHHELIDGTHYTGHPFTYGEAARFVSAVAEPRGCTHLLLRFDPLFIYGIVRRPRGRDASIRSH